MKMQQTTAELLTSASVRAMCAIALASSKGGTSKSTTAFHLGVRAAEESKRVVFIDDEQQHSLARALELRRKFNDEYPLNPRLWRGMGDSQSVFVPNEVRRLKQHGAEWIFVDLPPGEFGAMRAGVAACDFVLITTKSSPLDLEALGPVIQVCEEERRPYRFLVTMYDATWSLSKSAFGYLEKLRPGMTLLKPGTTEPQVMSYRQAYVGAMNTGNTGPEYVKDKRQAKDARQEIDAIWDAVRPLALAAARERAAHVS